MSSLALEYSADQAAAYDAVAEALRGSGIDLDDQLLMPPRSAATTVLAVTKIIHHWSMIIDNYSFH